MAVLVERQVLLMVLAVALAAILAMAVMEVDHVEQLLAPVAVAVAALLGKAVAVPVIWTAAAAAVSVCMVKALMALQTVEGVLEGVLEHLQTEPALILVVVLVGMSPQQPPPAQSVSSGPDVNDLFL